MNLNLTHWSSLTNRKVKIIEFVRIACILPYLIYVTRKNFSHIICGVNLAIALRID